MLKTVSETLDACDIRSARSFAIEVFKKHMLTNDKHKNHIIEEKQQHCDPSLFASRFVEASQSINVYDDVVARVETMLNNVTGDGKLLSQEQDINVFPPLFVRGGERFIVHVVDDEVLLVVDENVVVPVTITSRNDSKQQTALLDIVVLLYTSSGGDTNSAITSDNVVDILRL